MKKLLSIFVLLLLMAMPIMGFASEDIDSVSITQVENNGDDFSVLVNFLDENGSAIDRVDLIEADINGVPLKVQNTDSFESTDEGVSVLFLVDTSGSVKGALFEDIKKSISDWIDNKDFDDYFAIATFGENVELVIDFTDKETELGDAVETLKADENYTRLNEGIKEGLLIIESGPQYIPERKLIVILSDGENTTRVETDPTDEDIVKYLKKQNTPIFAIGANYSKSEEKNVFLNHLQNLADASNGIYFNLGDDEIVFAYENIREAISKTYVIDLAYEDTKDFVRSDIYRLTITCPNGTTPVRDSIDVSLNSIFVDRVEAENDKRAVEAAQMTATAPPDDIDVMEETPEKSETQASIKQLTTEYWYFLIAFLGLVLLLLLIVLLKKSKAQNIPKKPVPSEVKEAKNIPKTPPVVDNIKPIDPAFVDNLRPDSIAKTRFTSAEKSMLFSIQLPGKDPIQKEILISDSLIVGREESCDIQIEEDTIQDKAIKILSRNGYIYIVNISAHGKAYVNGIELMSEKQLKNGDQINIGNALIKVNY